MPVVAEVHVVVMDGGVKVVPEAVEEVVMDRLMRRMVIHLPHITMMLEMEQLTLVVVVVADVVGHILILQVVMVQVEKAPRGL
tara:strand:- start:44 stop:292 length:249 start_codon:yes stop_codon:yes gene_type:complete